MSAPTMSVAEHLAEVRAERQPTAESLLARAEVFVKTSDHPIAQQLLADITAYWAGESGAVTS